MAGRIEEKYAYLFVDFPPLGEITDKTRSENHARTFTGGVRINSGMYRTSKEEEEYREKSLQRQLP
jgi:hypothetical protein